MGHQATGASSQHSIRYVGLDGYRFIAAACVVLYHYDMDFGLGLSRWTDAPARFYMMVDFFFILSGFVIATAYFDRMRTATDYAAFLRARVSRIYPLHLLTLGFALLMFGASIILKLPINHPEIFALSGLPANLLMAHAWGVLDHNSFNVPSWSISAEWFVYLLAPALFALARRSSFAGGVAIAIALTLAVIGFRHMLGLGDWTKATYDFGALRALPTFFLGVILAREVARRAMLRMTINIAAGPARRNPAPRWWMAHTLFVGAILVAHFGWRTEIAIALFAGVVAVAALAERAGQSSLMRSGVMAKLGDASFAIYMLHTLAAVPMLFLLRKFGLIGTPAAAFLAIATFATVLAVALLSHRYFEQPARRWLTARLQFSSLIWRAKAS